MALAYLPVEGFVARDLLQVIARPEGHTVLLNFEQAMQSNEIIAAQCRLPLPCSSVVSMVGHQFLQSFHSTAKASRFPGFSKRKG